ncbi:MAG: hypothetical protein ACLUFL_07155 [Flavonifractor plautii]
MPWGKPAAANKTVRKKGHPYLEVFGIENITISIIGKPRNTCGFDRKKGQKEKKTPCFFRKARCFYDRNLLDGVSPENQVKSKGAEVVRSS